MAHLAPVRHFRMKLAPIITMIVDHGSMARGTWYTSSGWHANCYYDRDHGLIVNTGEVRVVKDLQSWIRRLYFYEKPHDVI